ncbi:MAG: hypothetical protein IT323_03855, partial [Anaerolineae bacterium]|nr:hypothetical protein [Anaerolineae bacterium]
SPPVIATWLAEGLQGVQRAEVLTWYQLPADVRGAFPCLMGAVGRLDDSLTVSGLRTDRYTLQPGALAALIVPGPLREASILPQTPIAVGDLRLANRALIGDGASGTTPCLVGQWRVDEQTPHDWKSSVEVLRHGGWALSQDSNVLDDRQLPTSLWPAGHAGASFTPLADPPRPLDPSTAYLVLLKAYHPANGAPTPAEALIGMLTPKNGGAALAEYDLAAIPRAFEAPELPGLARIEADFPGVGMLVGAALGDPAAETGAPPVTLLWRASATPAVSYTVFVHLVAPDGSIVAQDDSPPDGGYRRTTTWLSGEYILDRHTLAVNAPGYAGPAELRTGLYDSRTGERVRTDGGDEVATLPVSLSVELR